MDESPVPRKGEYGERLIKSECVTGYSQVKEETSDSLHFVIEKQLIKSDPCNVSNSFQNINCLS